MDDFVSRFLQELSANLFFVKDFFFFFERQILMIFHGKQGSNPVMVMTFFTFWNKALSYLISLYSRKQIGEDSFTSLFMYISENRDRLIPANRQDYFEKLQERYDKYLMSKGNDLDMIDKTGHYYHKTAQIKQENAELVRETVFDTIVFTNEMYVGLCNLFEVDKFKSASLVS